MAHYPDTPGHGQDTEAENTGWCPEDTTHNPRLEVKILMAYCVLRLEEAGSISRFLNRVTK